MPLADTKEFENSIWILEADTLLGHREDCNIRGATKVAFLEQMVSKRCRQEASLESGGSHFVNRGRTEPSHWEGAEDLPWDILRSELKSLEAEEITIADAIEISNQVLATANDQIKRAQEMIARANTLSPKLS